MLTNIHGLSLMEKVSVQVSQVRNRCEAVNWEQGELGLRLAVTP